MSAFQELIQSETPVLVDFYADWCGPCKSMNPVIQEVARITEGRARVIKINIDKNQAAAAKYNVKAVPTFLLFKKGEIIWRHSGMIDQMSLLKQLSI
ncbi:thioredoxin 1 [Pedobacter steynii]|jgi:thioredoxin 1|uniref:Thioredoxin n=1 Tax=Pedobacter steynii TaxID=430522 RepID=A0A1G9RPQ7_9SPHI|nr:MULTISPECIES: thioredoxin [Pedobacter]NQX37690.1 thioredoxin [Pedobacter steynii]RQO70316.1 thioredoxin [Pedobacter sp. KBW06]SDM25172.1 thioredoxin 1 [Pedobacter steynii]